MNVRVIRLFGAFSLFAAVGGYAGQNYPEPCNARVSGSSKVSPLCSGLIEQYSFEENSDSPRFGSLSSALLEVGGANTGRVAEIKDLDGGYSVDLVAGDNAWLWQLGGLPSGSSTIAMWFKPNLNILGLGSKVTLVSANTTNIPGPEIYLEVTDANPPNSAKVCYVNYEQESAGGSPTAVTVCTAADTVVHDTVTHVAAGESPHHTGKSRLWLALNGGTIATTAVAYWTRPGIPLLEVGAHRDKYVGATFSQKYTGKIDQLLLYSRALTQQEVNLLYNGGSGQAYPFSTE